MTVVTQRYDNLPNMIQAPESLRHLRTEVVFVARDALPLPEGAGDSEHPLMVFAGSFDVATEAELQADDAVLRRRRHHGVGG